jgi:capreomycidine synthase
MQLRSAPLEDWLRERYFAADADISSSGVQPYTMAEVRAKTGLRQADLDSLVFTDGYSLGGPQLRQIIAERWGDGDSSRVMTANGSSESISLVLMALLRPGDEVVVVEPGYHLLVEFAVGLGCVPKAWRLDPANGWRPDLDELAGMVTGRTRAIIVNFPQNPTGTSISAAELDRLVEIAREAGAYLLWDAAFADLTYDDGPLPDASTRYEAAISFGTFSKAFGLPGLRFGWCIGPPGVLADCVRIRDYTTLHVAPLIELLAQRVLENAEAFLEPRRKQARLNRDIVGRWAATHPGLVSVTLPRGGVAAFPRLPGVADVDAFCDELFSRRGVLVIPGSCFGAPEHVRLGFGGPAEQLVRGLDRLAEELDTVR